MLTLSVPWSFLPGKKTKQTRALLSGYIILPWEEFFTDHIGVGGEKGKLLPQDHPDSGNNMEARVAGSYATPP